jgi:hypothetical protein
MTKLNSKYSVSLLLKLMIGSIIISIIVPIIVSACYTIPPIIRIYISAGFVILSILSYITSFFSIVYLTIRKQ